MLVQRQVISPVGCFMLLILLALTAVLVVPLAAVFLVYALICRLLGVKRRPMGWPNYGYRSWRPYGDAAAGAAQEAAPDMDRPFGRPAAAAEDIIDVEAVEVEVVERLDPNRQLKE